MSLATLFHFLRTRHVSDLNVLQASACNTGTTQTQPHQISNTQRTENSRMLLMMDILISETCWVH